MLSILGLKVALLADLIGPNVAIRSDQIGSDQIESNQIMAANRVQPVKLIEFSLKLIFGSRSDFKQIRANLSSNEMLISANNY